jgi:hypothetical protein
MAHEEIQGIVATAHTDAFQPLNPVDTDLVVRGGWTHRSGATTLDLCVAGVQPSIFEPGKWNANSILPEQMRLGTYDTEAEALDRAERYRETVLNTLHQSTRLRKELDRVLRFQARGKVSA